MSREAWQEACVVRNFADSAGPFLLPVCLSEDEAWPLFAFTQERDFGRFLTVRNDKIDAFAIISK